jgi:hypothetical protein
MPPQQKTQTDPFEAAAAAYKGGGAQQTATPGTAGDGNNDWKLWQAQDDSADPQKEGFLESAFDATGLPELPHAIAHPVDTLSGMVHNTTDNVEQGIKDFHEQGLSKITRRDFGRAVPVFGPVLARAQEQHDEGNLPGMFGTLTGFVGSAPLFDGAAKGVGAGLEKIAPPLAESAAGIKAMDRAHGATPGRFLLDRTSGLNPEKWETSGRESLDDLHSQETNLLSGAPDPVYLGPTRNIAADFVKRSQEENHPETFNKLTKLAGQVDADMTTDKSIPAYVTPLKAAALKRGIANAKTSWNPATANDSMNAAAGMMHHQLADNIGDVVPEVKPINKEIQSGLPVIRRAVAQQQNEGAIGRTFSRIAARTGALTAAGFGLEHYGVPGAIAGLVVPEMIADPAFKMGVARGADALAPAARRAGPFVTAGVQAASSGVPRKIRTSPFDPAD